MAAIPGGNGWHSRPRCGRYPATRLPPRPLAQSRGTPSWHWPGWRHYFRRVCPQWRRRLREPADRTSKPNSITRLCSTGAGRGDDVVHICSDGRQLLRKLAHRHNVAHHPRDDCSTTRIYIRCLTVRASRASRVEQVVVEMLERLLECRRVRMDHDLCSEKHVKQQIAHHLARPSPTRCSSQASPNRAAGGRGHAGMVGLFAATGS